MVTWYTAEPKEMTMLIQTRPIPARDDADDDGRDGTGPRSPLIVSILASRTQLSSAGSARIRVNIAAHQPAAASSSTD
jgi:hypothetical protein